jgi:hypothetical protein
VILSDRAYGLVKVKGKGGEKRGKARVATPFPWPAQDHRRSRVLEDTEAAMIMEAAEQKATGRGARLGLSHF